MTYNGFEYFKYFGRPFMLLPRYPEAIYTERCCKKLFMGLFYYYEFRFYVFKSSSQICQTVNGVLVDCVSS